MNSDTFEKLRKLKFYGMFHAFKTSPESGKTNDYTADELSVYLVDAEWDDRNNRRVERQIYQARFRYKAVVQNIHYHADSSLDRNQVIRLADCSFITRNENLLITGSTGIGKSYVATAIAIKPPVVTRILLEYPKTVRPLENGQGRRLLYQGNRQDRTAAPIGAR